MVAGPLLLLLLLPSLADGRVVDSFTENNRGCPQYFFPTPDKQNIPIIPSILHGVDLTNHAYICQMFGGALRFATLYDKTRRIPVYSAYTFDPTSDSTGGRQWMIEPQLENLAGENMAREDQNHPPTGQNQALDRDYKAHTKDGSNDTEDYTRGHLYPCGYAGNKQSTCTLTNIAPQLSKHNGEWAIHVETPLKDEITDRCRDGALAYMVTGVVPSTKWLSITRADVKVAEGVNVPSYFWTAYCCDAKQGKGRVSGAFLSEHRNTSIGAFMDKMNVCELEARLLTEYNTLFGRKEEKKDKDKSWCDLGWFLDFFKGQKPVPYKVFGGVDGCGGEEKEKQA